MHSAEIRAPLLQRALRAEVVLADDGDEPRKGMPLAVLADGMAQGRIRASAFQSPGGALELGALRCVKKCLIDTT